MRTVSVSAAALITAAIIIAVTGFFVGNNADRITFPWKEDAKGCTLEALMCPDGSSVGRTGPNCQFADCPGGDSGEKSCTAEAMQCPDGSYVGRTGPNCQFADCPSEQSTATLRGTVVSGPTCPVVQNPPVEDCDDRPYRGVIRLINQNIDDEYLAVTGIDGTFSADISPGTYRITREDLENPFPSCEASVTLAPGETRTLEIACDSGIR